VSHRWRVDRLAFPTEDHPPRSGALDGVRAVAVTAVVGYHLAPSALPSGFLGVDVFMVVSGFIVTGLLMRERDRSGRIRVAAFWGRRFRRLVPAVMVLVAVVTVWVHVTGPSTLMPSVRSQGLAAVFYITNWRLIAAGVTYGGAVGASSPFVHLWSLAVEEQFYLCWPLLLLGLLALSRGRRAPVVAITAIAAAGSAAWMRYLYDTGVNVTRIYYGTDTRAQAFLVGALAALVAPHLRARGRQVVGVLGGVALLGVIAVMFTTATDLLYRGGFALVAIATALAALAAMLPGPVTFALDRAPFRGLGRVSYGVYLWYWPAITLLTPARVGIDGVGLLVLRLGVTAAGTAVSWMLVERPLARARPRHVALSGVVAVGAAAVALVVLPAGQAIAYSNFRTDRIPKPVLVTPVASTLPPAGATAPTGTAPSLPASAGALTLPRSGTAMIVGDSGMYSATPAFAAGLAAAGWRVVETAYPGVGLTNPPGLITRWRNTVREYRADLTIVMLGAWDIPWERVHGAAAYRTIVDQAVGAYTAAGGKVLWLSILPDATTDNWPLDRFYAALPARYPGVVEYLDIQSALRAPGGGWPRTVDGRVLRGRDGWHLCQDGAAAVAQMALEQVGLQRPGWETGTWRNDPGYEPAAAACRL
jgi:peptidoglycan/LPS O-acetylase OafA/YrhL/lysophospholipase L1-like esterase